VTKILPVPRSALIELFARASSARRNVDRLAEHPEAQLVERLADHLDAIVNDLNSLLSSPPLEAAEEPEQEQEPTLDDLRLLLGRADALAAATHAQLEGGDVLDRTHRRRLAHLVELTAEAVCAANEALGLLAHAIESSMSPEKIDAL
jgi:hypothetical protein